ncbi:pimeloyl-ACP methyl ester carboxylesterase [Motilibacter rhizosphaerae]|uniref:Pimeloyl-ACP methyl ester carboxylesterase n=1 Tax=Motilibacter rhizosphaerae TaxID=598652 RepID=A0A4Q7NVH1_9ACTN|nr:alpha/beta hydrolase [Motilibacter rhizosphaerae]RZS90868.1 pimeloyl-ACP methyl ester carboxylesterase [Motilibacter rhizosphaerae]
MTTTTHSLPLPDTGQTTGQTAELTVEQTGSGRPFLLLHGGAGPASVLPFAQLLAAEQPARVLVPTHPGFGGTPRPAQVADVRALAALYLALLDELDLEGVTVVGNSIGGWVAAEIAALGSPRVSGVVIVNGVGFDDPAHPVADFFALSLDQLTDLSYDDPDRFRLDPATLGERQKALMGANRQAIAVYGGATMTDPTLAARLAGVSVPTLVLWGQSDGIAGPEYGRAYAAAIPTARYQPLERTGHLPQVESPAATLAAMWEFAQQQWTESTEQPWTESTDHH